MTDKTLQATTVSKNKLLATIEQQNGVDESEFHKNLLIRFIKFCKGQQTKANKKQFYKLQKLQHKNPQQDDSETN